MTTERSQMVEINSGARLSLENGKVWRIAPGNDFSVAKRWKAGTPIGVVEKKDHLMTWRFWVINIATGERVSATPSFGLNF